MNTGKKNLSRFEKEAGNDKSRSQSQESIDSHDLGAEGREVRASKERILDKVSSLEGESARFTGRRRQTFDRLVFNSEPDRRYWPSVDDIGEVETNRDGKGGDVVEQILRLES